LDDDCAVETGFGCGGFGYEGDRSVVEIGGEDNEVDKHLKLLKRPARAWVDIKLGLHYCQAVNQHISNSEGFGFCLRAAAFNGLAGFLVFFGSPLDHAPHWALIGIVVVFNCVHGCLQKEAGSLRP
jgi:hypothetical protein